MKVPVFLLFILYTKHYLHVHGIFHISVSFVFKLGKSIDLRGIFQTKNVHYKLVLTSNTYRSS